MMAVTETLMMMMMTVVMMMITMMMTTITMMMPMVKVIRWKVSKMSLDQGGGFGNSSQTMIN